VKASFAFPLALALATLFMAGCAGKPRIAPLPADAVIVAFGDSLTSGVGADSGGTYPDGLSRLTGRRVINAGVPGEVTSDGLTRLPAILAAHRPALVILCHGGNDLLQRQDPAAIAANLQAMVRLIKASGADTILVAVPKPGLSLRPAAFYRRLAAQLRVPCDVQTLADILSQPALKSDTVHPNAQGYQMLAEAIARLIQESQRR